VSRLATDAGGIIRQPQAAFDTLTARLDVERTPHAALGVMVRAAAFSVACKGIQEVSRVGYEDRKPHDGRRAIRNKKESKNGTERSLRQYW
jgi:hypothetical protein